MSAEAVHSVARPFDRVLAVLGIPTEEQKRRIFAEVIAKKSTLVYFVFPEQSREPDKIESYSTSLTVPKKELEVAVSSRLRRLIRKEFKDSTDLKIQTRALPEAGNFWAIKDASVDRRIKLSLNGVLNVPTTFETRTNGQWEFMKKFHPFDLETLDNLIRFVIPRLDPKKLTSVGWPGSP